MVNHRFYSDELREFLKTNKLDKFDDIADTILIAIQEMATARKWPPRKTSDLLRPLLFCQTLTVTRSTPHVLASSEASSITKSERRKISLSKSFWEGLGLRVTLSCFAWVGIQGWALKNKTPDGPQTMRRVWMGGFSLLNTVTDFVDFLKRRVTWQTRWARCLGMSWRTTETS